MLKGRARTLLLVALAAEFLASCAGPNQNGGSGAKSTAAAAPVIEAEPVQQGEGNYGIITGDRLKLTIRAADAQKADLFYRPITAGDRELKLRTLSKPTNGNFVYETKTPSDFNGEVWSNVHYPNGEVKQTERLYLVSLAEQKRAEEEKLLEDPNGDESNRADKFTGGSVSTASFRPGDPDIRISVNVPAFLLTLWQGDKQVATYHVGVGRREFPIPIGIRAARQFILNPDWVPPDSEWVRSSGIEPYEPIPADDPDNPLGKLKIPLGDAYLLHEAQAPSDIGNLVSHGCVRVLRDDIFAIAKIIAQARGLPVSDQDFQRALETSDRRAVEFEKLVPVDINYDTIIVENGVLNIYPDVYRRNANTVENLRAELQSYGIDAGLLDNKALNEILERASNKEKFVVTLDDIKAGRVLERGRSEPVVPTTNNDKDNANKKAVDR